MDSQALETDSLDTVIQSAQNEASLSGLKRKNFILTLLVFFLLVALIWLGFQYYSSYRLAASIEANKAEVARIISQNYVGDIPDQKILKEGEIKGFVAALGDSFSEYQTAEEGEEFKNSLNERYEGIGINFRYLEGVLTVTYVIPNGPAEKSGLQIGDDIISVDGTNINTIEPDKIAEMIRGEIGTAVTLGVRRAGGELTVSVMRDVIQGQIVTVSFQEPAAIIRISTFGEEVSEKMEAAVRSISNKQEQCGDCISAVILDLRSNTGGLLTESVEVASYFVGEDKIVLKEKQKNSQKTLKSKPVSSQITLPTYILVNDRTASASEIVTAAIVYHQDATVVGQTTFGKGVVQTPYPLSNGDILKLTTAEWFGPDGGAINKVGIQPDIVIPITDDALEYVLERL